MDDCLIVGGGVIGLSLAYELAGHGWRVRVLDQAEPGRESSWAGAGILPPAVLRPDQHPLDQLRALSHALHPQWSETLLAETGIDNGFRRCGGIYLARSAGEAALLAGMVGMFRDEGIAFERLTPVALAELEPALAAVAQAGELQAAYLVPGECQLRNPRHLRALLAACWQRGVQITAHAAAEQFDIANGRCRGVQTSAGYFAAEQICVTSGAWTQRLLDRLGIPNGILPIRGQMALLACRERPFSRVLNEGPRYLVPRDDGRVLVGSSEEEVGFDKRTTEAVIGDLTKFAGDLVPALRDASLETSWAGLRPATFDGFPYLGKVPDIENLFVAAGHFRSGLHLSPGTAVVMSQLLRGETPQIDLAPFRIGRG